MAERRLTAEELAYRVGISARTVSNLRAGRSKPNERTLRSLEEFFGVRLSQGFLDEVKGAKFGLGSNFDHGFARDQVIGGYVVERLSAVNHGRVQVSYSQVSRDSYWNLQYKEYSEESEMIGEVDIFQTTKTLYIRVLDQIFPSSYVLRLGKDAHTGIFSTFQLEPPAAYYPFVVPTKFTKVDIEKQDFFQNDKYREPLSSVRDLLTDFRGAYVDTALSTESS